MARNRGVRLARARRSRAQPLALGTVVVDGGAVTRIADGSSGTALVMVRTLVERGWKLIVPSVVLVECLTGDARRDAKTNRFLQAVGEIPSTEEAHARAAANMRYRTRNPSVVDALVAECASRVGGQAIVLTTDPDDLDALVPTTSDVRVLGC